MDENPSRFWCLIRQVRMPYSHRQAGLTAKRPFRQFRRRVIPHPALRFEFARVALAAFATAALSVLVIRAASLTHRAACGAPVPGRHRSILQPGEILVEGDRIRAVGTTVEHPQGAKVIDLGDTTLMPGMIDAHVHLFLHPGAEDLQTVMSRCRGARFWPSRLPKTT